MEKSVDGAMARSVMAQGEGDLAVRCPQTARSWDFPPQGRDNDHSGSHKGQNYAPAHPPVAGRQVCCGQRHRVAQHSAISRARDQRHAAAAVDNLSRKERVQTATVVHQLRSESRTVAR